MQRMDIDKAKRTRITQPQRYKRIGKARRTRTSAAQRTCIPPTQRMRTDTCAYGKPSAPSAPTIARRMRIRRT